jgi:hypothetical protein
MSGLDHELALACTLARLEEYGATVDRAVERTALLRRVMENRERLADDYERVFALAELGADQAIGSARRAALPCFDGIAAVALSRL